MVGLLLTGLLLLALVACNTELDALITDQSDGTDSSLSREITEVSDVDVSGGLSSSGTGGADASDTGGDVTESVSGVNACGGEGELRWEGALAEPLDECAEDGSGRLVCSGLDVLRCVGESAVNACGSVGVLPVEPGDACGVCGDGRWACSDAGTVVCVGAVEANACGGCAALEAAPGSVCGDGDQWVCDGAESVRCAGASSNRCGGESILLVDGQPAVPGTGCETGCGEGILVCVDTETLGCLPTGDTLPRNPCGGCGPLAGAPGEPCGACGGGEWFCDGQRARCSGDTLMDACGGCSGESGLPGAGCGDGRRWRCQGSTLACEELLRDPQQRNACGGEGALDGEPGQACGACEAGVLLCAGLDAVACSVPDDRQINACGGCAPLPAQPGGACGTCGSGAHACDGEEQLVCEGDAGESARNACGGCAELPGAPGEPCGACLEWQCMSGGGLRCVGTPDRPGCGSVLTCEDLSCEVLSRVCVPEEGGVDARCGDCIEGRGNCDGDAETGCERDLLADASHCGACGNACAAGAICEAGGCACPDGERVIDGVCVLFRSPMVETVGAEAQGEGRFLLQGDLIDVGLPSPAAVGFCVGPGSGDPGHDDGESTCEEVEERTEPGAFELEVADPATVGGAWAVRAWAAGEDGRVYGETIVVREEETEWPQVSLPEEPDHVGDLSQTSVVLHGVIDTTGDAALTEHGFCVSATRTSPDATDECVELGPRSSAGAFSAELSSLTPGQTYHVRAFAENAVGRVWSASRSWRQWLTPAVRLGEDEFASVSETSVTVRIVVDEVGHPAISDHGVCHTDNESHRPPERGPFATCSSLGPLDQSGERQQTITGLTAGRTYHVRAYATNVTGTVYSEERSVTTLRLPVVETEPATERGVGQARLHGRVSEPGNPAAITAHGFCVSATASNPSLTNADCLPDIGANGGADAFAFDQLRTGLIPGSTYHVRAFATNELGTGYGTVRTVQTLRHAEVATQSNVTRTASGVIVRGLVNDPGVDPPATYGFCYGEAAEPTEPCETVGSTSNLFHSFQATIEVPQDAEWFVRAFAENSTGVRQYGESVAVGACEATDRPDGMDRNCDGIDGDRDQAIFVRSGAGNSSSCGLTPATACGSVSHAVQRAAATGRTQVLVASGDYTDPNRINLFGNVGIFGGYGVDFTTRDMSPEGRPVVDVQNSLAVRGVNDLGDLTIDRMVIRAREGVTTEGERERSSIGMLLHDVGTGVSIVHTEIRALDGAVGQAGAAGTSGSSGFAGGNASGRSGASGASSFSVGGGGWRGG
ncbi:MAG: hypothetical protein EA398_12810, partial [Deltaproteobacteria bacterium]